eukprot:322912_1
MSIQPNILANKSNTCRVEAFISIFMFTSILIALSTLNTSILPIATLDNINGQTMINYNSCFIVTNFATAHNISDYCYSNRMDTMDCYIAHDNHTIPSYLISTNKTNATITAYDLQYNAVFVFIHLNKAGGTTMKGYLKQLSEQNKWPISWAAGSSYSYLSFPHSRLIIGGYSFGSCDFVHNSKCVYFTVLRDPIQRAISAYNYNCAWGAEGPHKGWKAEWLENGTCPVDIYTYVNS